MDAHCSNCGKEDAKFQCGKCKSIYYCNTDCQKGHWICHELSCLIDVFSRCEKSMNDSSIFRVPHPISCRVGAIYSSKKSEIR